MTAYQEMQERDKRRNLYAYARESWGCKPLVELTESEKDVRRENCRIAREASYVSRQEMIERMKEGKLEFFVWKGKAFPLISANERASRHVGELSTLDQFFRIPSERSRLRAEMEAEIRSWYQWVPVRELESEYVVPVVDLEVAQEVRIAA